MPSNHLETNNRRDAFKCMCVSMLAASCVFTCSRVVVVVCMSHLHVWLSQIPGMRWHEGYYHGDTRMWVGRKERQRDEQTLNMITMIRLQTTMTMHCRSDDIWCCDSSHQCVVGDDAEYLHSARIMYHNNSIQHCSCYCLPWQQLGQSGHWLHQAVLQLRQLPAAEVSPSSSSVLAGAGGVTGLARTVHSLVQSVYSGCTVWVLCRVSRVWSVWYDPSPTQDLCPHQVRSSVATLLAPLCAPCVRVLRA